MKKLKTKNYKFSTFLRGIKLRGKIIVYHLFPQQSHGVFWKVPDKLKTEQGATTILLAFFIMNVLLIVSLTAASVMIFEIKMSAEIANSALAFYAADAGAEKCLYQMRKLPSNSGDDCTKNNQTIQINLDNGAVGFAELKNVNKLQARGSFGSTRRQVELNW